DAVIDVENILRRRRSARESLHPAGTFLEASLEVRRPVLFATAAVAVAFLPIVMMSGLQGAFFRPLSVAFLLAVGLSLIVAMSVTPALCALTMTGHRPAPEARFLAALKRAQLRAILWLHGRPRVTMAAMVAAGAAGMVLLPLLGARLLPDFREDYLIAHASLRPGVALAETVRVGKRISHGLMGIPGVVSVAEQIGRAENGQDPDAPNKSEFELQIDPRAGGGVDRIEARIRRVFADFPNQLVEIYSVLAERIGETLSGQTAPFSIDVFGADLDTDDRVGEAIVRVLGRLPDSGTVRLGVPPQQVEMRLRLRPRALAVHGLQAADVLQAVDEAFQGAVVATVREADRGLPVVVRLKAGADPGALGRLMLRGADGTFTPLSSVARIDRELARSQIQHQDGLRRQVVVASPRSADLAGFERAARAAIAARVKLPAGIFLRYEGAAEAQRSAARELLLHSAAALVVIVLLLALAFGDARQVGLVLVSLPSTMIGGVAAVAATGAMLTLGSMVGFVALFGMAGRNTILLVSHFDHLVQVEGQEWCLRTAMRGAEERLTPVLLTALSTGLALLPVAWQLHRPGHEIEGPMAVVILGGLVSSTLVSLLLVPPLSVAWLRYRPR
ncbi:MAG: efflux RND transporter permease subunit, partial [Gammaproteobacteria bacterium]|nr:efflux RND transporter permease subunit [Gammaproteobacteria bacterium]